MSAEFSTTSNARRALQHARHAEGASHRSAHHGLRPVFRYGRILCSVIADTVGWHDPIGGTSNTLLTTFFVERVARQLGKQITGVAQDNMEILSRSDWPRNIRELQNVIERAVVLSRGSVL